MKVRWQVSRITSDCNEMQCAAGAVTTDLTPARLSRAAPASSRRVRGRSLRRGWQILSADKVPNPGVYLRWLYIAQPGRLDRIEHAAQLRPLFRSQIARGRLLDLHEHVARQQPESDRRKLARVFDGQALQHHRAVRFPSVGQVGDERLGDLLSVRQSGPSGCRSRPVANSDCQGDRICGFDYSY